MLPLAKLQPVASSFFSRLQHASSLTDAPPEQKMHECNKHFIPKYGEIKPAIDLKPGEMRGGGGDARLLISKLAVIPPPPPPPFSLSDRAFPQRLGSNCRSALCGNC